MSDAAQQAALSSWSLPFWATVLCVATAVFYVRGWKEIRRTRPAQFPAWRLWCFVGGLASVWVALASPLDTLDGLLLVAHMTQHLVLMSVAPPLLLLGAPVVPLLRGLPRVLVREGLGPFLGTGWPHRIGRALTQPTVAWLAMNVAYVGWHVPAAYELALRSPGWHQVEHGCFLVTSLMFWTPVIEPWPIERRWSRWAVLPYLLTADLVNTVVCAVLTFSTRVLYPSYAEVPRIFGLSALGDQAAAGALMWVIGSTIYLVPAGVITLQLLSRPKPARAAVLQGLSVPFRRRRSEPFDALRLPGIGWLLRARYGRMGLQAIAFVIAVVVIAEGFRGPQMGAMNLAGVLPWTYLRALGVIALLAVGNVFCMACPFTLPREVGHRLGLAKLRWPRLLRSKWIAVGLLIVFFWANEAFAWWDHPARTAWLLLGYFGGALVVDTFFQGASFCKYVCPLGQFNFAASLLSPLSLQARQPSTCTSCATHDCIRGNARQRGCELQLYMPEKVGNMDCTLCMDCVKACPHNNIGLFAVVPLDDLQRDPLRAGVRRLSQRVDIAVLALLVVLSAFASAAVMIEPADAGLAAMRWRSLPPAMMSALTVLALVFATVLIAAGVSTVARRLGRSRWPLRAVFCRFALALLPLGLAMWCAHLIFHLVTGWTTLDPALHQAARDLGVWAAGAPAWAGAMPMVSGALLKAQLLVLDVGLLASLYLGWRLALASADGVRRAVLLLSPWATMVIAIYAIGFWMVLQPMQMRGVMR